MKKIFQNCLWILPTAILLGVLLLMAVYLIPASCFTERVGPASAIILDEQGYPLEIYSRRQLDNFTDSLMLLEAGDGGEEGLLDKAVNVYYTAQKGITPDATLADHPFDRGENAYRHGYARYWHGFLIFLKPAYALLGYNGIRTLNLVLQYSLLMAILLLLQRKCPRALIPFILMILFLAPTAIGKSLQFSSVYYIILLECLLMLWNPGKLLEGDRIGWLFLFSGIAVAYLDLLTYPTAALNVPLVLLGIWQRQKDRPARESLRRMLLCALLWFLGYAGMWAGKWLLAALLNGSDFINTLMSVIEKRSSATNGFQDPVSRGRSLLVNVKMLLENRHLLILSALYALAQIVLWARSRGTNKGEHRGTLLVFLIPAAIGVCWNLVLSNHSTAHCWFTYRTLAPAVFSLLTMLSLAAGSERGEGEHG